jgi:hypothetical protein
MVDIGYPEHVVYRIRSAFEREPNDFHDCPMCSAQLDVSALAPSVSVQADLRDARLIPIHDASTLFHCGTCHWWCFRETWSLYELHDATYDFLVVGCMKRWDVSSSLVALSRLGDLIREDRRSNGWSFEDQQSQTSALMNALAIACNPPRVEFLGISVDDVGPANLYQVDGFSGELLVLSQTANGWIDVEAVEVINGIYDPQSLHPKFGITSVRQFHSKTGKPKQKRRVRLIELSSPDRLLPLLAFGETERPAPWLNLLQKPDLYTSSQELPVFLVDHYRKAVSSGSSRIL